MEVGGGVWVERTDEEVTPRNVLAICGDIWGRRNISKCVVALKHGYTFLEPGQTGEEELRERLKPLDMDLMPIQNIHNNPQSAWQVIDHILKRYVKDGGNGMALDLVDQLIRNKWRLEKTTAGRKFMWWENTGLVDKMSWWMVGVVCMLAVGLRTKQVKRPAPEGSAEHVVQLPANNSER